MIFLSTFFIQTFSLQDYLITIVIIEHLVLVVVIALLVSLREVGDQLLDEHHLVGVIHHI
jgi:competence protein ComGF